jgi:hypothetical protein
MTASYNQRASIGTLRVNPVEKVTPPLTTVALAEDAVVSSLAATLGTESATVW